MDAHVADPAHWIGSQSSHYNEGAVPEDCISTPLMMLFNIAGWILQWRLWVLGCCHYLVSTTFFAVRCNLSYMPWCTYERTATSGS